MVLHWFSTMREFDVLCLPEIERYDAANIKAIRENAHVSQSVFAAYLNTSPSTVRSWEQGEKSPKGTSLKLLNLVANKGLDVLAYYMTPVFFSFRSSSLGMHIFKLCLM